MITTTIHRDVYYGCRISIRMSSISELEGFIPKARNTSGICTKGSVSSRCRSWGQSSPCIQSPPLQSGSFLSSSNHYSLHAREILREKEKPLFGFEHKRSTPSQLAGADHLSEWLLDMAQAFFPHYPRNLLVMDSAHSRHSQCCPLAVHHWSLTCRSEKGPNVSSKIPPKLLNPDQVLRP